jgi:hypothetical protein
VLVCGELLFHPLEFKRYEFDVDRFWVHDWVQLRLSMANCYLAKPHGMQHCYIPFFMLLISNALLVLARHNPKTRVVRSCYPMRQNPQKGCVPCRLGTIIDFRVSGRHFAPALAKRSVKQTPYCRAAHGERIASKKLTQFALRFRTEIHHFAWRLLLKCGFWRKLYQLEGLLKRCFLGEVLFPARTALCKI